nr:hypothetical protein [Tanacetum cinerariifolium]
MVREVRAYQPSGQTILSHIHFDSPLKGRRGEEEEEKEETKNKGSMEASEMRSNSESSGYATSDNKVESDLESTSRSKPKCKEMEDTCESGV